MGCRIGVIGADNEQAMPLDYSSMLLGTSPPTAFMPMNGFESFGEAPNDFLAPFACRRVASFPMVNRHSPISSLVHRSISESDNLHKKANEALTLADLKRELSHILEEDEKAKSRNTSRPSTPLNGVVQKVPSSTPRKRVVFADEKGLELTTVKIMSEGSDTPPKLSSGLLRRLLGEAALDGEAKPASTWEIDFAQPACDYLTFRQKLEKNNLGLENAIVKNEVCRLTGTVKVKNVAFEKEVFLRLTDNDWTSFMDYSATYTKGIPGDIYDTFAFDIQIPADDDRRQTLEFCVCFKTGEREFWDSNQGKNYKVVSEELKTRQRTTFPVPTRKHNKVTDDPYNMQYNNWSEFSVLRDVSSAGPYW